MNSSDLTKIKECIPLYGCLNKVNYTNITISSVYASFSSSLTQTPSTTNPTTTPIAITYNTKDIGNIDVLGSFPSSQIKIPVTGIYKVLFSAQSTSISGNHYLEIWPVINGISVPNSNTRIKLQNQIENCLTVEYILSFNENDILRIYMIGDSSDAKIIAFPGNNTTTPIIPNIPSIILTIMRIA